MAPELRSTVLQTRQHRLFKFIPLVLLLKILDEVKSWTRSEVSFSDSLVSVITEEGNRLGFQIYTIDALGWEAEG